MDKPFINLGEIALVFGKNNTGKSTLFKIINNKVSRPSLTIDPKQDHAPRQKDGKKALLLNDPSEILEGMKEGYYKFVCRDKGKLALDCINEWYRIQNNNIKSNMDYVGGESWLFIDEINKFTTHQKIPKPIKEFANDGVSHNGNSLVCSCRKLTNVHKSIAFESHTYLMFHYTGDEKKFENLPIPDKIKNSVRRLPERSYRFIWYKTNGDVKPYIVDKQPLPPHLKE